jgi:hypothetical protein
MSTPVLVAWLVLWPIPIVGLVVFWISKVGWLGADWASNLLLCALVLGNAYLWIGGLHELMKRISGQNQGPPESIST